MTKFLALLLAFTILHAAESQAGWDKDIHWKPASSGSQAGDPKTGK